MKKPAILLVERDPALRLQMTAALTRRGFAVMESTDSTSVLQTFRYRQCPDLLLLNASLDVPGDGLKVTQLLHNGTTRVPVILITTHSSEDLLLAALRAGVADCLKPPFSDQELIVSVERCLASHRHLQSERQSAPSMVEGSLRPSPPVALASPMIGESPQIQEIKAYIGRVAAADSNALITGETGTGKELVATLIHQQSPRREKPFVSLNCAAIPDSLLESELFGHERGAFTGAERLQEGVLRSAAGGTVFFDEIGDMSSYAQAKILRAIESKEVRRLGGKSNLPLDIRVVAATNRDLEKLVAEEKFRADLYFRLNVANVHLPSLRERKEDLLMLANHYIQLMNRQFGQCVEGLTEEVLAFFLRYDWPGNVRELKNLIEAIFINLPPQRITIADLPEQFRKRMRESAELPQDERNQLLQALFATNWNKRLAAQKLHWSRMTLYRKLQKYHIVAWEKRPRRKGMSLERTVTSLLLVSHLCDTFL